MQPEVEDTQTKYNYASKHNTDLKNETGKWERKHN